MSRVCNQSQGEFPAMNIVPLFPGTESLPRPPIERLWHPVIYCGGRMSGCRNCQTDWRRAIPGFSDFDHLLGGIDGEVPIEPKTIARFRLFDYGGPFVIDQYSGHAVGHSGGDSEHHHRIWENDRYQIERCHLFVAWLQDLEGFGTLVEIGLASALGKPIALGFSKYLPREDFDELWFARAAAARVYVCATPSDFWRRVQADWIATGEREGEL
jgi:hypothetical protein